MKIWFVICFAILVALPASALHRLNFDGFIADEANLLSKDIKYDLNMTLWDLQKKSGADIAVITLPSLEGKSVEDTALEIGRTYKIGSKDKNNGVVFLTTLSERKMRIELGSGLEKKINMKSIENIRDNDILPYYRKSDYQNGIARGTYKLAEIVAQAEGVEVSTQGTCPSKPTKSSSRDNYPWWVYVLAIIMAPFMPRRCGYGYGGFSGFGGGGGFGGCGCSGSW